jgi:hypothetical protein
MNTRSKSDKPTAAAPVKLDARAPTLRTADEILQKNEQIFDGLDRGTISAKVAEQLSQCVKTPLMIARLELLYMRMLQTAGRTAPVPRSPLVRSLVGLNPHRIESGDGEKLRNLAGALAPSEQERE